MESLEMKGDQMCLPKRKLQQSQVPFMKNEDRSRYENLFYDKAFNAHKDAFARLFFGFRFF